MVSLLFIFKKKEIANMVSVKINGKTYKVGEMNLETSHTWTSRDFQLRMLLLRISTC